jgi:maltose O-acetyltransferase
MDMGERMERGELFRSGDPQLDAERLRATELCREYNALAPADRPARDALLRELLGEVGVSIPDLWRDA